LIRLEKTVSELVARLDQNAQQDVSPEPVRRNTSERSMVQPDLPTDAATTPTAAPVFLIRDAASEIGVRQPNSPAQRLAHSNLQSDIISKGFLSFQEATSLLGL